MRSSEFTKHVGNIVLLDLVTGMQICTELKAINHTASKIEVGKIVIFQIAVEPKDPTQPPHEKLNPIIQKLNAQPYGGPFTVANTEHAFDFEHILFVHVPVDGIEKAYLQSTSGIEVVGAGAMAGLKGGPSGIIGA